MVLITDDGNGGCSSPVKLLQVQPKNSGVNEAEALAQRSEESSPQPFLEEDESLGSSDADLHNDDDDGDEDYDDDVYEDFEEYDDFSELPDTRSIVSDDSFYPPDDTIPYLRAPSPESPEPLSFFQACCNNNVIVVKIMIRQGVTEEEVRETDRNNRTGLIVACYQGYVDIVIALAQCPYIDVNWQDKEGNTALITAAQAGHLMISNYLLNYFPGLDIECRNCHGFTAVMKAAMQGRAHCVRALMLAGADLEARDFGRKLTPRQWALFTGRYETAYLMMRLMAQPCAEQFCESYRPEWPLLPELVAKAQEPKSCLQRASERLCGSFTLSTKTDPQEDGVMDHMVRMTTSLGSPFIATACRTVCPGSPPCVGKRRLAVQDILRRQRLEELKRLGPEHLHRNKMLFQNSRVQLVPRKAERRASLQPQLLREVVTASAMALRRSSLLPLHMMRRNSVRPGIVVPRVRMCKAPPPTYKPERVHRKSSKDGQNLQIPKWKYKELKEERKRAEAAERKRTNSRRLLISGKRQ